MKTAYYCSYPTTNVDNHWFGTNSNFSVNGKHLPLKDGYEFNGWKITSGGGSISTVEGKANDGGKNYSYIYDAKNAGNVTITAQWKALPKITVNPNGGKLTLRGGSKTSNSCILTYYPNNTEKRLIMMVGYYNTKGNHSTNSFSQYDYFGTLWYTGQKTPGHPDGKTFNGLQVTENGTTKTYSASDLAITGSNTSKTTSDGKITVKNNGAEAYSYYYNVANSTGDITIKLLWK